jgi:hypothetical protein
MLVRTAGSLRRERASPPAIATARHARQLDGLAGGLEPPASAADSIAAAVGGANAEHFFVGTQDATLRELLRKARATGAGRKSALSAPPPGEGRAAALRRSERRIAGASYGGPAGRGGALRSAARHVIARL